jgi:6-pyruvoyltetrahydropterin/6-carboxytetrahydropterin synthase
MSRPRKTTYTVSKDFDFECAHILEKGCNAACADTIHGHSYKATIHVTTNQLNAQGMVFDFSTFSDVINTWRSMMDHALVIPQKREGEFPTLSGKIHLFEQNPTAENFALMLLHDVEVLIDVLIGQSKLEQNSIVSVATTVWETAKCRATVVRNYEENNDEGQW